MYSKETQTFQKLQQLISDFAGYDIQDIRLETAVNDDVRIQGDDAVELIQLYAQVFQVDVRAFEFRDYFADEGIDLFAGIWVLLGLRKRRVLRPLLVKDLMRGIEEGILQ